MPIVTNDNLPFKNPVLLKILRDGTAAETVPQSPKHLCTCRHMTKK